MIKSTLEFLNTYFDMSSDNYKYVVKYSLIIGLILGSIIGFKLVLSI